MNVGRNELCPCGSRKKYKKCCMNKETEVVINKKIKIGEKEIDEEKITDFFNNFQKLILKNKPNIKKYEKIRKLHGEIIDSMMQYNDSGKFKLKFLAEISEEELLSSPNLKIIDSHFDTSTQLGAQAMGNVLIYKNSKDMNCITEEYIKKNKFRKPEKIEMLNSMLNSVAGLFEITNTNRELGEVYLRDVFTKKEYCVTDIGLSSNFNNETFYMYMRIITYDGISFGTGLNLIFNKKDKFICNWIKENLKEYNDKQEMTRFQELYNEFERDNKGIKLKVNSY